MQSTTHNIAFVGFSTFEFNTFSAFFETVSKRRPVKFGLSQDPSKAGLVFYNAEDEDKVRDFASEHAKQRQVVLIGHLNYGLNLTTIPKPVRLLRALAVANDVFAEREKTQALVNNVRGEVQQMVVERQSQAAPVASPGASSAPPSINSGPAPVNVSSVHKPAVSAPIEPPPEPVANYKSPFDELPITSAYVTAMAGRLESDPPEAAEEPPRQPARPARFTDALSPAEQIAKPAAVSDTKLFGQSTPKAPVVSPAQQGPLTSWLNKRANAITQDDGPSGILVVDDSDVALKFMQEHLGEFGFHVELAKSGEECLLLLSKRAYRCVFMDVMMSGMDGYQTCKLIKQRKYSNGYTPIVVMMTSRGGAFDRVRGALAGCDAYLVKPVDEEKLIKALFQHKVPTSTVTTNRLRRRLSDIS